MFSYCKYTSPISPFTITIVVPFSITDQYVDCQGSHNILLRTSYYALG